MIGREVEKYRTSIRVLHWIHASAFVILFLTGLVLFIPQFGFLAVDSWSRLIHRIAAAIFIIVPLIYLVVWPKDAIAGLKRAFTWGAADLGWLRAAPQYYFLGDEAGMPPQGAMNSGQKMWWFITVVFGVIFVITGLIMWFAVQTGPLGLLRWMVFVHDIAFIVTGAMLFLHIYLGVFHPMMTEAWKSMATGKISVEYAKMHHGKWLEEITSGKDEKTQ